MSRPQILIVEDEGIVAADLQRRVTRMGYDAPQISSTADDAVAQAQYSHPNLVLMDIHLKGDVDGVTAAERIRSSLGIPVVFLTAFSDEDTLLRAKATEPYGYLLKPFGETELRMTIDLALQNHTLIKRVTDHETSASSTLVNMADGVIRVDANGDVISMNPAAESLTGWSEAQADRRPIGQVLRVKDELVSQMTANVMSGSNAKGLYPLTLRSPESGALVPIEAHVATLRAGEQNVCGAVIVIREVKNRLSRETPPVDAEDRAGVLVRAFPDAIFRLDRSGTLLDAHLPGMDANSQNDLLGTNLYSSQLPKVVVDQILTAVRWALENREVRILEFALPSATGVQRQWAHIVPSGKDEAVMLLRDITAFRSPETLRQVSVRDLLDKEIEALSESVEEALRNPLVTTYEICDHFTANFNSYLPVEGRACVRLIKEKSIAMRDTMDDVAFYLGLRTRPVTKTTVALQQLVRDVVKQVARRYGSRQVHVSVSQLPDCFACEPLLRRLFNELLDNAFKFTRRRGNAQIQIGSQKIPDGIFYYVRDNGVGFDDRHANQIFGPFHRQHQSTDYRGVGLGLAIAHRIIERHGGQIWAEGNVGKGASFSFTLPYLPQL